ncbi:diguanylate cyclase [Hippea sp. KM1]|uniref:diguanylate cyclase n=1 Tax=Hippea sp. KM1 TaxID=944481 RepID=UPI00046D60D9|nr:diguanylate cyclase [Hippea sp. KM1]
MKKKISLSKLLISTIVASIITTSLIMSVLWFFDIHSEIKSNFKIMQKLYMEDKKQLLKHRVQSIISYINSIREENLVKFKENLKQQTGLTTNIMESLYLFHKNKEPDEIIKRELIKILKDHDSSLEGNFVVYSKDKKKIYGNINCKGLSFKTGYTEAVCNNQRSIGYGRLFKPFNWYVVYLDTEKSLKEKTTKAILEYLNRYRYGREGHGYIFVSKLLNINGGDCFAIALVNPNKPQMIGKCLSDKYKDPDGKPFRKIFLKELKQKGYALLTYKYKIPNSDAYGLKLSYMVLYKPYNWIIGTGYYLKDLKKAYLNIVEKDFKNSLSKKITVIIIITSVVILILLLLYAILSRTIRRDISTLENFFNTYSESKRINTENIKIKDIEKIAEQINNITSRIETYSQRVKRLLKSYQNLVKYMPDCLILYEKRDKQLIVKDANRCVEEHFSNRESIVGKNIQEALSDIPHIAQKIEDVLNTGSIIETDYYIEVDGQKRYFSCTAYPLNENECVSIAKDITDSVLLYRKTEEEREKLKKFINIINAGVLVLNSDGKVVYINEVAKRILEIDDNFDLEDIYTVLGLKNWGIIKGNIKIMTEGKEGCKNCNVSIITKTDKEKWLDMSVGFIELNKEQLFVVSFYDTTERYKKEKEVEYVAFHDSLTGLYNRRFFEEETKRLFNRRNYPLTLIIYDLNGLKIINDAMGHQKGDYVIKSLARILSSQARASDIVARIGGDEFAIIMPNTSESGALKYIERVNKQIEEFNANNDVFLSASCGYAVQEGQFSTLKDFFSTADANMYKNKYSDRRKETLSKIMDSVKSEKIRLPKEILERYQ